jgi:murein DD-endopeptidase MepM/ murein hydrolase activator NlpD
MTRARTPQPVPSRALLCALAVGALALGAPAACLASEASAGSGAGVESGPGATSTAPAETAPAETTPTASAPQPAPGTQTTATSTEPQTPASGGAEEAQPPLVQAQHRQGASPSGAGAKRRGGSSGAAGKGEGQGEGAAAGGGVRAKRRAPSPTTLTPSLPLNLRAPIGSVPAFFIESFQIPPFLLPILQAAGTAYGIPWQVLAAINEVETDYGRDLSVSSAGAEGWMQFLPSEWAQYGVDANGDGFEDPYNPADAIFAAARYLRAAGGDTNIKAAVFSYNHSQAYVESVMLRAQLLGGTPSELLGAITGLTEARFPVHAPSHFSDGFQSVASGGGGRVQTLVGTTVYSQAGAPVIAVQDGEVVRIGDSPSLGRFIALRDAYGNTYVYAQLGDVSSVYPVLEPRVRSTPDRRSARHAGAPEAAPSGPATAGAQPRSPLSEAATVSGLALGAAAGLESIAASPTRGAVARRRPAASARRRERVRVFAEGPNDVYLHPLVAGVQVIAGTVLGHVGGAGSPGAGSSGVEDAPHILFQVRPAGVGAPLIDPKPILDGWVALEDSSIFRAKGESPFLASTPSVGQVLLESKQQLEPQVLHGDGVRLGACARHDVQEGRVDKRVLAMLEYLSVSGLQPTVSGLPCTGSTPAAAASNAPASASSQAVSILAVNGIPIAGHQGAGSLADQTVRRLLMLQGLSRPSRIVSLMSYPGAPGALASPRAANAIRVAFAAPGAHGAHTSASSAAELTPNEWVDLIDRLGEIPDPTVAGGHSSAAVADGAPAASGEGQ